MKTSSLALFLSVRVDRIAQIESAGRCFSDVRRAVELIDLAINRARPLRCCGLCPTVVDDAASYNGHGRVCSTELRAKPDDIDIQCPTCKTTYNVDELIQAALERIDGLMYTSKEIKFLMAELGQAIPERTWRRWRAEGRIKPRGEFADGTPGYWISDVRDLRNERAAS